MPVPLRQSKKYYLSVEGETERWYFEHLRGLINASNQAQYKLTLKCDVQKEPLAMAKGLVVPKGPTIDVWHVFDFESESEQHRQNFQEALRQINSAFGTNFQRMDDYKKEDNFKAILSEISLDDVAHAVERAKVMNEETDKRGARTAEHCGFVYRLDNPYTELHVPIESMLRETHVLPAATRRAR
jgi:hypothetical protein